ncbi:hypothetical protein ERJ75_001785700 [Trypanosoma vivax]|nr:hypothetical protein ERJ75_001785700 [Trypanosoma vivax]
MTQLAVADGVPAWGTLVSTRRGSATSAAKGANIGAASILCEAALQADEISAQAKALPCDAVKRDRGDTEQRAGRGLGALAQTLGKVGEANAGLVGNWTASGTGAVLRKRRQGTDTRVCSAKNELDTCTKAATEAQREGHRSSCARHATAQTKWYKRVSGNRASSDAKNLCLGATMVYVCTGADDSNPCFSKGAKEAHSAEETQTAVKERRRSRSIWRKQRQSCARQKQRTRNIRSTSARFWAQERDRSSGGDKEPQLGVCANYGGTSSDKGCLEYATTNTTEVFWMKTLLDADDALHAAENALAAANRTLDDVTRLSENAQDKHKALVAALTRENGAQARDADEAPQSTGASAETVTKGDAQRDSRKAPSKDTPGEESNADTQSSTNSAHFGWLGVQLAAGMTTFAGRHAEH